MKLKIIITLLFISLSIGTAYGESRITREEAQKYFSSAFPVNDFKGNLDLGIVITYLCKDTIEWIMGGDPLYDKVNALIKNQEETHFFIWIQAFQETYFSPLSFSIVQDGRQFNTELKNVTNLENFEFTPHLHKDVIIYGVITFSPHIDITKPMLIYYDDTSADFFIPEKYHDIL